MKKVALLAVLAIFAFCFSGCSQNGSTLPVQTSGGTIVEQTAENNEPNTPPAQNNNQQNDDKSNDHTEQNNDQQENINQDEEQNQASSEEQPAYALLIDSNTYSNDVDEIFVSLPAECSIKLLKDVQLSSLTLSTFLELDLNGHSLEIIGAFCITNRLDIKDSYSCGEVKTSLISVDGGKLDISGGRFDCEFDIRGGATLEITGGMFSQAMVDNAIIEYVPEGYCFDGKSTDIGGTIYHTVQKQD